MIGLGAHFPFAGYAMDRPRLDAWALSLQERSALWLQRQALALPPDRLLRRHLILLGARRFAPLCVREALAMWHASTEAHAPVYRAFWQGVYDFMPYLGPETEVGSISAEPPRSCRVSVEDGKRFYDALVRQNEAKESEALDVRTSPHYMHPSALRGRSLSTTDLPQSRKDAPPRRRAGLPAESRSESVRGRVAEVHWAARQPRCGRPDALRRCTRHHRECAQPLCVGV